MKKVSCMTKKALSLLLALCMLVSCAVSFGFSASAEDADIIDSGADEDASFTGTDYGLGQSCRDGNILHCFNWTLSQIKQELPNIAQAGFTSVQTSPLQGHDGQNKWYWLYQPTGFTIGNELGSYDELKALCAEADKYGIKIIVDVVANHLAGSNSGSWAYSIESSLKKSEYFHNLGPCNNYDDRYQVTQKNIGMPDLNSENKDIQNKVSAMIERLKNAGVDGIRWDAAKHIALPSEGCGFWSKMAQTDMYQYGEILDAPAGKSSESVNNPLMQEYSQYIGVTDSRYSSDFMSVVNNGSTYKTNGYWIKRDIPAEKIVYWAESHDTYSNKDGWTKNIDQNTVDKAYAILAARADSQALYLSRPFEKDHESIRYAKKGSTHFTSKEVAAVNHFHNAMIGTDEKYSSTGGCYVVWRSGGAVIVSIKGSNVDVSVANSGSMVPVGTYTDEVSGSSWTVTETKIIGHIGSSGIAVIYNGTSAGKEGLLGDTDLSGEIEVTDATFIQRKINDIELPFTFIDKIADADGSGDITVMDATFIQKWLVKAKANEKIGKPVKY